MNCQEVNYLIDSTETENLNADQKQAVDQHLRSCRRCQETWAAYRQLSAIEIPAMPHALHSRIVSSLNPTKVRGMRRSLTLGAILVVGAAVAATVVFRIDDAGPKGADGPTESMPIDTPGASAATTPNLSAIQPEGAEIEDSHSKSEDSASRLDGHALDPNSIVIYPAPDEELSPRGAELFALFHQELMRQLHEVPGLNVIPSDVVKPYLKSGMPEEEVARGLGAAHLFVLATSQRQDSRESLNITTVNVATGIVDGNMFFSSLLRNKWPENLEADVDYVVEFIEEERTASSPTEISAAFEDARATVLNASLRPAERVGALGRLPHTAEARDDAIVIAAVELAAIAPEQRGMIWRAMHGVEDPYLVEPMLHSLTYDVSEYSRRLAAASLGTFVSSPNVRAALVKTQSTDPSEIVRESARAALLTDEDRNMRAIQILADKSLPALERISALTVREGRNHRAVPLTDEAARVLFAIGETSSDPEVRSRAWSRLGRDDNKVSDFKRVFLDDLANHPSDLVRKMAAFALRPYTNDLDVRTALARAEGDPSFQVRSAARSVLARDHR